MPSNRSSMLLAAVVVVGTLQIATPARAEAWSLFSWISPAPTEKPRVTTRVTPTPAPRTNRVAATAAGAGLPVGVLRMLSRRGPLAD